MAKKVIALIKLQVPAGKANPSPPVGPALGQHGVNIMEFCKSFNERTKSQEGMIIPVVISVYADRSFSFITKTPPAAILLKKAAGIAKASGEPNRNKVGTLSYKDIEEIAKQGAAALENRYSAGVVEALDLFAELLGYTPPYKTLKIPHQVIIGKLDAPPGAGPTFGPLVLFDRVHTTCKLIEASISLSDREQVQSVHAVADGTRAPSAEGPSVFTFLKTVGQRAQYKPT